jgi:hypothetical protein
MQGLIGSLKIGFSIGGGNENKGISAYPVLLIVLLSSLKHLTNGSPTSSRWQLQIGL